jgi:hypothetical protein
LPPVFLVQCTQPHTTATSNMLRADVICAFSRRVPYRPRCRVDKAVREVGGEMRCHRPRFAESSVRYVHKRGLTGSVRSL